MLLGGLSASGTVNDGNSGNNYSYTFHTASGTINKYALDVTAATDTKTYNGTTSSSAIRMMTIHSRNSRRAADWAFSILV